MSEFNLGMAIELLVAVLLVVTIGYCMLLNRRLTRLRADELVLRATIAELLSATEVAERAIQGLKQTAVDCDLTLGVRMKAAETVIATLQVQMEAAEKLNHAAPRPQSISQTMAQAAAQVPVHRATRGAGQPQPQAMSAPAMSRLAPSPPAPAVQAPPLQAPAHPAAPVHVYGQPAYGHPPQTANYGEPAPLGAYSGQPVASPLEMPFLTAMYDGSQMAPPPARPMSPPPPAPNYSTPNYAAPAYGAPAYGAAPQPGYGHAPAIPAAPPTVPAPSAARHVQAAAAQAADRLRAYRKSTGGEAA